MIVERSVWRVEVDGQDVDGPGVLERKVSDVVHGVQAAKQRLVQDLIFDFALGAHPIPSGALPWHMRRCA